MYLQVFEQAAAKLGLDLPLHRGWMTGEQSLRDLLQQSGRLEIEIVQLVAQTGVNKSFRTGAQEAEGMLASLVGTDGILSAWYDSHKAAVRADIRKCFFKEWAVIGNVDGKIEEVDGAYVAVARLT